MSNGETFEGKTVKLEADLDMGREEWFKGIGGGGTQFGKFSGTTRPTSTATAPSTLPTSQRS